MNPKPVLYAEDEENDVFFLQRAFKAVDIVHPLVIVRDGQEAIDYCAGLGPYANRADPYLIVLDLNMPRRSGIQVLDWIRNESNFRMVPVIILTSSLQESDILLAYKHGVNAYLVKPFKPNDLNDIARSLKDFWLTQNRTPGERLDQR